jgi:hypothetical protein
MVSASEAEQLLTKGRDAGRLSRALPRLRKTALWLLALLVASWVLPALTRQWSDRQAELTLKTTLLTKMSEGLSRSVAAAETLVQRDPPPVMAASARDNLLLDWEETEANVRSILTAYFGFDSESAFAQFGGMVSRFIALSCCDDDRETDVDELRNWYERKWRGYKVINPPPVQDPWGVLTSQTPPSSYLAVYDWFGDELVDSGFVFSLDWQEANAQGFSTEFGDFLRDVLPWY